MFHPDETLKLDTFTGSNGSVNIETKGHITELVGEKQHTVSKSFKHTSELVPTDNDYSSITDSVCVSTCFEGPMVKVWKDLSGNVHLSTNNKLDCTNSFWGNKEERFGELFYSNGGTLFTERYATNTVTHHFMVVTRSLMNTSEIQIGDNDCVVVYLGSVDHQNEISMLEPVPDVFVKQENHYHIPSKESMANRVLYPYISSIGNDVNLLLKIYHVLSYGLNPLINDMFSKLSVDEQGRGVSLETIKTYFGNPMILRNNSSITKFLPIGYHKKCSIIGNNPNIRYRVYRLMDHCIAKKDSVTAYYNDFDYIFAPTVDFLKTLITSPNIKRDIVMEYRKTGSGNHTKTSVSERERNLLVLLILSLPENKGPIAIHSYLNYLSVQSRLMRFITSNKHHISLGKTKDLLLANPSSARVDMDTLDRIVKRITDIYTNTHAFAVKEHGYMRRFKSSLRSLISNEYGASLYKIERVIGGLNDISRKHV